MFNFDCDDNNCFQICLNGLSFFPNEMNNDTFVPENNNELYFIPNSDLNRKLTNSNKNEYNKVNTINCSSTKIESTNDKSLFSVCSVENIKKIFSKNKNLSQINEKFQENDNIKEEEDKLLKRKRKRDEKNSVTRVEIKEENKTKRGRKRNDNSNRQEHNKNSSDNIIKKIKTQLFVYLFQFLNNMFEFEKDQKLCKLDYKIINQINKDNEIKLLRTTLEDLFSSDISPKYISKSTDFNKKLILKKIKPKEEVKDYDTVLFVLNMTFGEWFDLFRYKKDIKDIQKEYQQIDNIKFDKIAKSFVYVDNLLNKMIKKQDEKYFSLFIFFIYNYERWFAIKSPRKNKSQNI